MEQLQSHIWLTASSYMGKYLRISSYILGSPSSYMILQLLHSEFPYIWGKFYSIFYQCILSNSQLTFLSFLSSPCPKPYSHSLFLFYYFILAFSACPSAFLKPFLCQSSCLILNLLPVFMSYPPFLKPVPLLPVLLVTLWPSPDVRLSPWGHVPYPPPLTPPPPSAFPLCHPDVYKHYTAPSHDARPCQPLRHPQS